MDPPLSAGGASGLQDGRRAAEVPRQPQRLLCPFFVLRGHIRAVLCQHPLSHALRRRAGRSEAAVDLRTDRDQPVPFSQPLHPFIFLSRPVISAADAQQAGAHQYIHSRFLSRIFPLFCAILPWKAAVVHVGKGISGPFSLRQSCNGIRPFQSLCEWRGVHCNDLVKNLWKAAFPLLSFRPSSLIIKAFAPEPVSGVMYPV